MNIRSHPLNEIWQQINSGAKVVDVRTSQEFEGGHLENAQNIPHDQADKLLAELSEYKSKPVVVYCKSGGRSDFAMKFLQSQGFEQVFNAGGYEELVDAQVSSDGSQSA